MIQNWLISASEINDILEPLKKNSNLYCNKNIFSSQNSQFPLFFLEKKVETIKVLEVINNLFEERYFYLQISYIDNLGFSKVKNIYEYKDALHFVEALDTNEE